MHLGTGFNYCKQNWREKRRKRCKVYLTKLGRKLGFDVFPHAARKSHEYMVDLCWISQRTKRWNLELAVEMEWDVHPYEVQYDFTKLVNLKSPKKIMLCAPWPGHRLNTLDNITRIVRESKYSSEEEQYAIIFFVYAKDDRELVRKGIEARGFLINYKGEVTCELIADRDEKKIARAGRG